MYTSQYMALHFPLFSILFSPGIFFSPQLFSGVSNFIHIFSGSSSETSVTTETLKLVTIIKSRFQLSCCQGRICLLDDCPHDTENIVLPLVMGSGSITQMLFASGVCIFGNIIGVLVSDHK